MKNLFALLALVSAVFAPAQDTAPSSDAAVADPTVAAAEKRLRNYLDETETLTASFRSLVLDEEREPLSESVGTLSIKRPGRFRWEETAPEPLLLVTDGTSLWNYDAELEQVTVQNVSDLDRANPAQLLGGGADLERDFVVVGGYRVDTLNWVDVRPRATTSDFDNVRFGFDDSGLAMMELRNKLGQITQVVLDDVAVNKSVADDQFRFVPPPGTDIVDGS